jgi:L-threonylcarbamoyladenylate synthase
MDLLTPSADTIARTVSVLNAGGIARISDRNLLRMGRGSTVQTRSDRIYVLKHRPPDKALPVIIADREQLFLLAASVPATAEILIDRFWPGRLPSFCLPCRASPTALCMNRRSPSAFRDRRLPSISSMRPDSYHLTTSANPSGQPPAATAGMIREYFPHGIELLIEWRYGSVFPAFDHCGSLWRSPASYVGEGAIPPASLFSALR